MIFFTTENSTLFKKAVVGFFPHHCGPLAQSYMSLLIKMTLEDLVFFTYQHTNIPTYNTIQGKTIQDNTRQCTSTNNLFVFLIYKSQDNICEYYFKITKQLACMSYLIRNEKRKIHKLRFVLFVRP